MVLAFPPVNCFNSRRYASNQDAYIEDANFLSYYNYVVFIMYVICTCLNFITELCAEQDTKLHMPFTSTNINHTGLWQHCELV